LEAAVVDLHGLVTRAGRLWALPLPRDRKHSPCRRDLDRVGVDAGKLDDDVQGRWVVGAEAVTLGAEAATLPGERRHLPEVREELLDLALKIVEMTPSPGHRFGS